MMLNQIKDQTQTLIESNKTELMDLKKVAGADPDPILKGVIKSLENNIRINEIFLHELVK